MSVETDKIYELSREIRDLKADNKRLRGQEHELRGVRASVAGGGPRWYSLERIDQVIAALTEEGE